MSEGSEQGGGGRATGSEEEGKEDGKEEEEKGWFWGKYFAKWSGLASIPLPQSFKNWKYRHSSPKQQSLAGETESQYVAQAGLLFLTLLCKPPECWDHMLRV